MKDEEKIVEKYGHWFEALTYGDLEPFTELQKNFVKVAQGEADPISIEEIAWFKYMERKKIEEKYPNIADINYRYEEEGFYTRKMAKQMKSMMYSEMGKNHNL